MSFILGIIPSFFVILTKIFVIFAKNSPPTPKKTQSRCPPTIAAVRKIGGKISRCSNYLVHPKGSILLSCNFVQKSCKSCRISADRGREGGAEEGASRRGGRSLGGRRQGTEARRTTDIYYYMERKVFCASALSAQKRHATFDLFRAGRSALCALVEWCAPHSKRGRSAKRGTPCVLGTHGVLFSATRQAVKRSHAAAGTNCTARRSVERILRGSL